MAFIVIVMCFKIYSSLLVKATTPMTLLTLKMWDMPMCVLNEL